MEDPAIAMHLASQTIAGFHARRTTLRWPRDSKGAAMTNALNAIEVITLFVEDLDAARTFYRDVFASEVIYEDKDSVVLKFGNLMINLLKAEAAPELIEPAPVASPNAGSRFLLTINVADVNVVCVELARRGVKLLNGPIDRPWGRRTAAFADPAGHIWEAAQNLTPA
jgi:catechol 2,3-dioxygenase-like lactoylglutathione lyase family enzyme